MMQGDDLAQQGRDKSFEISTVELADVGALITKKVKSSTPQNFNFMTACNEAEYFKV